MFYHLEGVVSDIEQNLIVLDCAGIGFAVNASMNTIAAVHSGEIAKLYISESVREDAFDLYGFASKEEKRCFEMLIGISGVGPKAAISILSSNTPGTLALAVLNGDVKSLTAAPGIGKKIAQRIVLELKDKVNAPLSGVNPVTGEILENADGGNGNARGEALNALVALGYTRSEALSALASVPDTDLTSEEYIKKALKQLF